MHCTEVLFSLLLQAGLLMEQGWDRDIMDFNPRSLLQPWGQEKNGLKLLQKRFRLAIRENLFMERVAKHWESCLWQWWSLHPWRD